MDLYELFERAAPPCQECGRPVQRAEILWGFLDHGRWKPTCDLVCTRGHRVRIEPFETS